MKISKANTDIPEDSLISEAVTIKTTYPPGRVFNVYVMSEIGYADEYIELIDILAGAKDTDTFNIYLNTPGGNMDTAIMIVNALASTEAITTAYLTGNVASAGTVIALACDALVPMAYSEFMIHTYSMGAYGKGHELDTRVKFTSDNWKKFAKDVYTPFLTDDELDSILKGQDMYFSASEVVDRWERVIQFREKQADAYKQDNLLEDTNMIIQYLQDNGYTVTKSKTKSKSES